MTDACPQYSSFDYTTAQETQVSSSFVTKNWMPNGDGGGDGDDNSDDDEWIELDKASICWSLCDEIHI